MGVSFQSTGCHILVVEKVQKTANERKMYRGWLARWRADFDPSFAVRTKTFMFLCFVITRVRLSIWRTNMCWLITG